MHHVDFTLDGSDYPSHTAQEAAIAGYVRWANRRARPKQQFAWAPRSADPITYPTLLDAALAALDSPSVTAVYVDHRVRTCRFGSGDTSARQRVQSAVARQR
jgi:hypothetical protein